MLKNLEVKYFLSLLADGGYALRNYLTPAFPTINVRTATVTAKTANYTITQDDLETPTIFTNEGDSGTQVLTLPTVSDSKNKMIRVHLLAAQIVQLNPYSQEKVNLNGDALAGEHLAIAGVIGNYVELFCDGVQWIVARYSGVLTKAADSSLSPSVSPSLSPSLSPSVSPSLSPSLSPSVSPSISPSPSA